MMAKKNFELGDLVWAKMKYHPHWPSKIVTPPADAKPRVSKKAHHCVHFFGTENYAFIPDEDIEHHSEKRLENASTKKKSTSFKLALERIAEEAKKQKSSVKEKESPKKSSEASRIGRKTKVQKKPALKKRPYDEFLNKRQSPPQKLTKKSEDDPALNSEPSPSLQPSPSLNLLEKSAAIQAKDIRPTDKKIGFIGLGLMGQIIVKNLIRSGHNVTVWNRTLSKCVGFVEIGAQLAQTPCELVEKCDLIFSCVTGPDESKSLVFGNWGILWGLEKSAPLLKGYVELSAIDPRTSLQIEHAITYRGGRYLEAPIIGSRQTAEVGNLLVLGAGDFELFLNCESCFLTICNQAYYLSSDTGIATKMNFIFRDLIHMSHAALTR